MVADDISMNISNLSTNISQIYGNVRNDWVETLIITDEICKWFQCVSVAITIIGNIIVLIGYIPAKRSRDLSLPGLMIQILAGTDLLYAGTQIFDVHRRFNNNEWIFGDMMCKLFILSNASVTCSMFVVMLIALERHRSLVHPLKRR